jgi:hypothetical protein
MADLRLWSKDSRDGEQKAGEVRRLKVEKLRNSQGMVKKDNSIMVFKVIESVTHQFE